MDDIKQLTRSDFDNWSIQKKDLHEYRPYEIDENWDPIIDKKWKPIPRKPIKEWEIWWCRLGVNVGQEIFGKWAQYTRPVLIIKKISWFACLVIPSTSEKKIGTWFYPLTIQGTQSYLIFPQIRHISTTRFTDKISELPESEFQKIKKAAWKFYGFT